MTGRPQTRSVFSNITNFQTYTVIEGAAVRLGSVLQRPGLHGDRCERRLAIGIESRHARSRSTWKKARTSLARSSTRLQTGTLTVIKHVVNDNGGTATAGDWSIHVKQGANEVTGSPQAGAESPGTSYTLAGGSYTVSETGSPSGYTFTGFSGDCDVSGAVTVVAGQNKTCTLTNNDNAPALHLRKIVINDNGGPATVADFTLTANGTGTNDLSGISPVDSDATLDADTFVLSETSPAGYTNE